MSRSIVLGAGLLLPQLAMGGGGPANTLVLFQAGDDASETTAAYYAEARQLPPGHQCPVSGLEAGVLAIPFEDYEAHVLTALDACLDALPQPDEIDVLVLTRGLPYRVDLSAYSTSLSAILQIYRAEDVNGDLLAGKTAADLAQNEHRNVSPALAAGDASEPLILEPSEQDPPEPKGSASPPRRPPPNILDG